MLDEKRGLSVHLQPPGKKPLAWLKVIQTVSSHIQKSMDPLPAAFFSNSVTVYVYQTPFSVSLQLFISLQSSSGADPWQGPVILLPNPYLQALFPPVSTHTSHRHSSSPSLPWRDGTVDRMLCCGEPAANGKRRGE